MKFRAYALVRRKDGRMGEVTRIAVHEDIDEMKYALEVDKMLGKDKMDRKPLHIFQCTVEINKGDRII